MLMKAAMIFRFEKCTLDPARRSLYCAGEPVTLTPKTFDLLLYMVAHADRVVTKEELLRALWPDSFVEESNLSQHVFLLRKAMAGCNLGDRVVVTRPGRGYQFGVQVDCSTVDAAPPAGSDLLLKAVQTTTTLVVTEESETGVADAMLGRLLPGSVRGRRWLWIGVASVLVLGAWAGGFAWLNRPRPVLRKVVLAQFKNQTGEAVLDSLQSGLRIDLEQSPYVELMAHSRIAEILESMNKPADTPVAGDVAREVCERGNYQVLLDGAIARIGSQYLLTLEADNCDTGEAVAAEKETVSDEGALLGAMDAITRRMRRELGESRHQVAEFQVPLAQATTNSLQALRAYSQGLEASDRGDAAGEQALLQRAIVLDPNFASAYKELGLSYSARMDFVRGATEIQKAYDLRASTTERERMAIEIAYNTFGIVDYEAAIVSVRAFSAIYPDDASNWFSLCRLYAWLGEYPQAVEAGEHGYQLAPHSGAGAETLTRAYKRAGRFADAKRVAAAALAEGKDRWGLHSTLLDIAFAEHDTVAMKAQTEWALSHPQLGQSLGHLGFIAASQGKLREAKADFARARQEALHSGDNDYADNTSMFLAGILLEYGDPAGAAESLKQMRTTANDEGTSAYFWALLGNPAPAQQLLARIAASNSRSTLNLYFDLPELRACLDLQEHKPQQAVADLEPARRYQLRDLGVPYQRARAETEAGMLDQAIADYRLLLANPGIEPTWPEFTLTHLRLARVLAANKQTAEARLEYQAFLEAWKNGDPDLPLLIDAKREYAALRN
jgi:DNA-binding winged helix-turn-helix (wHTH) protein